MVYETRMAAFEPAFGQAFGKERAAAEAAAREAGAIVKHYYDKPIEQVAKSDKGAGRDENWLTQADSEFDRCIARRGEALSLLLDEEPTYAHMVPVYYYQGRVREGLKTAGFAESYRNYLTLRGQSKEDPLLGEVRRRAAGG